ncbi:hypothetical protein JCM8547_000610 [Rhodosporidiobolus lusitaniae]
MFFAWVTWGLLTDVGSILKTALGQSVLSLERTTARTQFLTPFAVYMLNNLYSLNAANLTRRAILARRSFILLCAFSHAVPLIVRLGLLSFVHQGLLSLPGPVGPALAQFESLPFWSSLDKVLGIVHLPADVQFWSLNNAIRSVICGVWSVSISLPSKPPNCVANSGLSSPNLKTRRAAAPASSLPC